MIAATLDGVDLPVIEQPFTEGVIENAADIVTLDGTTYTDFTTRALRQWSFSWDSIDEAVYNSIRAIYDSQFTDNDYPLLSIPYYSISNVPVRMNINTKDIWNNCGDIQNVTITLKEANV